MKTSTWVWIVVVVIIVVGLGWWWYASQPGMQMNMNVGSTQTTSNASSTGSGVSVTVGTGSAPMSATVDYTSSGFSPSSITVAQGATVTFVNQTDNAMWVASDPHPIHNGYDGTDLATHCAAGYTGPAPFDECTSVPNGGTFVFTFDKTGSWGYHNHMNPGSRGTIVVQ